jgi:hypothetical protein
LFAIDQRTHQAVQWFWGWSPGDETTSGWNGSFSGFAVRYPFLAPLAPLADDQPDSRLAVSIPLDAKSPLTFYAALDIDAPPVVDVNKDILFVLGFVGPQSQIYWAQRLQSTTGL